MSRGRLSLHPLTPEQAIADLLKVPPEHEKKSSQKPKAARKKRKKRPKRKES